LRIRRMILLNPISIGQGMPTRLLDWGQNGVRSIHLAELDSMVEVLHDGEHDPILIPLSSVAALIPDRESAEDSQDPFPEPAPEPVAEPMPAGVLPYVPPSATQRKKPGRPRKP